MYKYEIFEYQNALPRANPIIINLQVTQTLCSIISCAIFPERITSANNFNSNPVILKEFKSSAKRQISIECWGDLRSAWGAQDWLLSRRGTTHKSRMEKKAKSLWQSLKLCNLYWQSAQPVWNVYLQSRTETHMPSWSTFNIFAIVDFFFPCNQQ